MAIVVASGTSTPGANTKTADLISGTYQFVGAGTVTLVAKQATVIGINATLMVGGVPLINDQPLSWYGTAGTLSITDNVVCSQAVKGGRVELYFRNTTATAGTLVDYIVMFTPGRG